MNSKTEGLETTLKKVERILHRQKENLNKISADLSSSTEINKFKSVIEKNIVLFGLVNNEISVLLETDLEIKMQSVFQQMLEIHQNSLSVSIYNLCLNFSSPARKTTLDSKNTREAFQGFSLENLKQKFSELTSFGSSKRKLDSNKFLHDEIDSDNKISEFGESRHGHAKIINSIDKFHYEGKFVNQTKKETKSGEKAVHKLVRDESFSKENIDKVEPVEGTPNCNSFKRQMIVSRKMVVSNDKKGVCGDSNRDDHDCSKGEDYCVEEDVSSSDFVQQSHPVNKKDKISKSFVQKNQVEKQMVSNDISNDRLNGKISHKNNRSISLSIANDLNNKFLGFLKKNQFKRLKVNEQNNEDESQNWVEENKEERELLVNDQLKTQLDRFDQTSRQSSKSIRKKAHDSECINKADDSVCKKTENNLGRENRDHFSKHPNKAENPKYKNSCIKLPPNHPRDRVDTSLPTAKHSNEKDRKSLEIFESEKKHSRFSQKRCEENTRKTKNEKRGPTLLSHSKGFQKQSEGKQKSPSRRLVQIKAPKCHQSFEVVYEYNQESEKVQMVREKPKQHLSTVKECDKHDFNFIEGINSNDPQVKQETLTNLTLLFKNSDRIVNELSENNMRGLRFIKRELSENPLFGFKDSLADKGSQILKSIIRDNEEKICQPVVFSIGTDFRDKHFDKIEEDFRTHVKNLIVETSLKMAAQTMNLSLVPSFERSAMTDCTNETINANEAEKTLKFEEKSTALETLQKDFDSLKSEFGFLNDLLHESNKEIKGWQEKETHLKQLVIDRESELQQTKEECNRQTDVIANLESEGKRLKSVQSQLNKFMFQMQNVLIFTSLTNLDKDDLLSLRMAKITDPTKLKSQDFVNSLCKMINLIRRVRDGTEVNIDGNRKFSVEDLKEVEEIISERCIRNEIERISNERENMEKKKEEMEKLISEKLKEKTNTTEAEGRCISKRELFDDNSVKNKSRNDKNEKEINEGSDGRSNKNYVESIEYLNPNKTKKKLRNEQKVNSLDEVNDTELKKRKVISKSSLKEMDDSNKTRLEKKKKKTHKMSQEKFRENRNEIEEASIDDLEGESSKKIKSTKKIENHEKNEQYEIKINKVENGSEKSKNSKKKKHERDNDNEKMTNQFKNKMENYENKSSLHTSVGIRNKKNKKRKIHSKNDREESVEVGRNCNKNKMEENSKVKLTQTKLQGKDDLFENNDGILDELKDDEECEGVDDNYHSETNEESECFADSSGDADEEEENDEEFESEESDEKESEEGDEREDQNENDENKKEIHDGNKFSLLENCQHEIESKNINCEELKVIKSEKELNVKLVSLNKHKNGIENISDRYKKKTHLEKNSKKGNNTEAIRDRSSKEKKTVNIKEENHPEKIKSSSEQRNKHKEKKEKKKFFPIKSIGLILNRKKIKPKHSGTFFELVSCYIFYQEKIATEQTLQVIKKDERVFKKIVIKKDTKQSANKFNHQDFNSKQTEKKRVEDKTNLNKMIVNTNKDNLKKNEIEIDAEEEECVQGTKNNRKHEKMKRQISKDERQNSKENVKEKMQRQISKEKNKNIKKKNLSKVNELDKEEPDLSKVYNENMISDKNKTDSHATNQNENKIKIISTKNIDELKIGNQLKDKTDKDCHQNQSQTEANPGIKSKRNQTEKGITPNEDIPSLLIAETQFANTDGDLIDKNKVQNPSTKTGSGQHNSPRLLTVSPHQQLLKNQLSLDIKNNPQSSTLPPGSLSPRNFANGAVSCQSPSVQNCSHLKPLQNQSTPNKNRKSTLRGFSKTLRLKLVFAQMIQKSQKTKRRVKFFNSFETKSFRIFNNFSKLKTSEKSTKIETLGCFFKRKKVKPQLVSEVNSRIKCMSMNELDQVMTFVESFFGFSRESIDPVLEITGRYPRSGFFQFMMKNRGSKKSSLTFKDKSTEEKSVDQTKTDSPSSNRKTREIESTIPVNKSGLLKREFSEIRNLAFQNNAKILAKSGTSNTLKNDTSQLRLNRLLQDSKVQISNEANRNRTVVSSEINHGVNQSVKIAKIRKQNAKADRELERIKGENNTTHFEIDLSKIAECIHYGPIVDRKEESNFTERLPLISKPTHTHRGSSSLKKMLKNVVKCNLYERENAGEKWDDSQTIQFNPPSSGEGSGQSQGLLTALNNQGRSGPNDTEGAKRECIPAFNHFNRSNKTPLKISIRPNLKLMGRSALETNRENVSPENKQKNETSFRNRPAILQNEFFERTFRQSSREFLEFFEKKYCKIPERLFAQIIGKESQFLHKHKLCVNECIHFPEFTHMIREFLLKNLPAIQNSKSVMFDDVVSDSIKKIDYVSFSNHNNRS